MPPFQQVLGGPSAAEGYAISHQIRLLEAALGQALFQRLPRGLQLTDAGRAYAATVGEALGRLEAEAARLAPASRPRRLRVSLPDVVAHEYAVPALSVFRARHPHLDFEINATMALADVEAGEVDAAVRIGPGQWGNLHSHRITELFGVVVAAPALAAKLESRGKHRALPMVCLSQLEEHTREVLSAAGLPVQPDRVLRMDSYLGLVQAAEQGLGVAVLYAIPDQPLRLHGRLVALTSEPIAVPFAMFFVCRQHEADCLDFVALRDWLVASIVG